MYKRQVVADGGEPHYLLPWQPWPHVRAGAAPNEIGLDVDNSGRHVTARINRELLWQDVYKRQG